MTQFYLRVRVIPVRVSLCLGIVCVCVFGYSFLSIVCVSVFRVLFLIFGICICICILYLDFPDMTHALPQFLLLFRPCSFPGANVENIPAHFLVNTGLMSLKSFSKCPTINLEIIE